MVFVVGISAASLELVGCFFRKGRRRGLAGSISATTYRWRMS
jgi:hypothetical protein